MTRTFSLRKGIDLRAFALLDTTGRRSRTLPYRWDAASGRLMATTPVTIRIDVDPVT